MPQSAPGDLLVVLAVFDGAVILDPAAFQKFAVGALQGEELRAYFLFILVTMVVFWGVAVLKIERAMHEGFDRQAGFFTRSMLGAVTASLFIATIACLLNSAPFTLGR